MQDSELGKLTIQYQLGSISLVSGDFGITWTLNQGEIHRFKTLIDQFHPTFDQLIIQLDKIRSEYNEPPMTDPYYPVFQVKIQ